MTKVNSQFMVFAEKQNATFKPKTKTVKEKQAAITAKTAIMKHKDCPAETKAQLKKEIEIINNEIKALKNAEKESKAKENKETSIFKK